MEWHCPDCKSLDVKVSDEKFKVIFEWYPQKPVELEYKVPMVVYCGICNMHFCHPKYKKEAMHSRIEEYKDEWKKKRALEAEYEDIRDIVSSYSELNREEPHIRAYIGIFIRFSMLLVIFMCWVNAFIYRNKEIKKDLPWLYKIFKNDDIIEGIINHFTEREKELVNKLTGRA